MNNKKGFICCFTAPDGKKYIEKTRNPEELYKNYINGNSLGYSRPISKRIFRQRMREIGASKFQFVILNQWDDISSDELKQKEREFIYEHKSNLPEHGYNYIDMSKEDILIPHKVNRLIHNDMKRKIIDFVEAL